MKRGLMDPSFRYVKASETDIRKTFARVRRQLKEQAEEAAAKKPANVKPIRKAAS